jgi:hypothetical protein
MLAVNGFLEDGRFTPVEQVTPLPRRVPAILVFNEADAEDGKSEKADNALWLRDFHRLIAESAHENDLLLDEAFARRPSGRELNDFNIEGNVQ